MSETPPSSGGLYQGLIALDESGFPHTCSCSRYYPSLEQFVEDTTPVSSGSGLSEMSWYREHTIGLWRNCQCGSTMMVLCSDRRDTSEQGRLRRERFGEELRKLQQQNFSIAEARAKLLGRQGA